MKTSPAQYGWKVHEQLALPGTGVPKERVLVKEYGSSTARIFPLRGRWELVFRSKRGAVLASIVSRRRSVLILRADLIEEIVNS